MLHSTGIYDFIASCGDPPSAPQATKGHKQKAGLNETRIARHTSKLFRNAQQPLNMQFRCVLWRPSFAGIWPHKRPKDAMESKILVLLSIARPRFKLNAARIAQHTSYKKTEIGYWISRRSVDPPFRSEVASGTPQKHPDRQKPFEGTLRAPPSP